MLNVWPDPAALPALLAHLSTYGKLYPTEVGRSAQAWLPLLTEAGWLAPLAEETFGTTAGYFALPADLSNLDRQRHICFKFPAYRAYLIAVLTQRLVQAGQVDYHKNLSTTSASPFRSSGKICWSSNPNYQAILRTAIAVRWLTLANASS